jgi:hypothetical protein
MPKSPMSSLHFRISYHIFYEFGTFIIPTAEHSGMNRFRPLEHWDRGSETYLRHGCLRIFCVRVVLCLGSGLPTG